MTAEDIKLMQEKIVALCHSSGDLGMRFDRLKRALIHDGYGMDKDALARQLKYLKGEGLIVNEEDPIHPDPDLVRWKSTSEGDKLLIRSGLI